MRQAAFALEEARNALESGLARSAAREAYSCCLSIARALTFGERQVAPKTHSGARSTISDILRSRTDFPKDLGIVLAEGYKTKERIDYGPPMEIDLGDAARRVEKAEEPYRAAQAIIGRQ